MLLIVLVSVFGGGSALLAFVIAAARVWDDHARAVACRERIRQSAFDPRETT